MRIGISAGDPAGIGLEVTLRSIPSLLSEATWILYAPRSDFDANFKRFGGALKWVPYTPRMPEAPGTFRVAFVEEWGPPTETGVASPATGQRALSALSAASRAALDGEIDGLVTAPLSKQWVGGNFRGHTEYLADRAGVRMPAMSFFTPTFKVVLATTHVSLRESIASLSIDRYTALLTLIAKELERYGMARPRIAVAALNPHAGEGGMFGSEDDEILRPAVRLAQESGLDVSGPHSADSLYHRAHSGEFDVVVAPYHDQGLIPVKLIAPRSSANVTLGLPYVRTSPDHGTAFEIAGQGVADTGGMETAMRWALDLVRRSSAGRSEPKAVPVDRAGDS